MNSAVKVLSGSEAVGKVSEVDIFLKNERGYEERMDVAVRMDLRKMGP